jgi:hypothetical protein
MVFEEHENTYVFLDSSGALMSLFQTTTIHVVSWRERPFDDRCSPLKSAGLSQEYGQIMVRIENLFIAVVAALMDSDHCFIQGYGHSNTNALTVTVFPTYRRLGPSCLRSAPFACG